MDLEITRLTKNEFSFVEYVENTFEFVRREFRKMFGKTLRWKCVANKEKNRLQVCILYTLLLTCICRTEWILGLILYLRDLSRRFSTRGVPWLTVKVS